MSDRYQLIARKEAIRRQIAQIRRRLESERAPVNGSPNQHRIAKLETQLERLMAQEYSLRQAIDRSPR
jgi:hypothetical protein